MYLSNMAQGVILSSSRYQELPIRAWTGWGWPKGAEISRKLTEETVLNCLRANNGVDMSLHVTSLHVTYLSLIYLFW